MAWQKNATVTPKVGNDDLQGNFFVPGAGAGLHFQLVVKLDGSHEQISDLLRVADSTSLTSQEKTQLQALLVKLRDECLTRLGFTNV